MATSNRERVGTAMDRLRDGLLPFVTMKMEGRFGPDWWDEHQPTGPAARATAPAQLDVQALLKMMSYRWNDAFNTTLGRSERSLVNELIDVRNAWAHQEPFSTDDTVRALDSIARLLRAVSAGELADEVDRQRHEVLRLQFESYAKREEKKATTAVASETTTGLRPWREIITPHRDVQLGVFQQAEFAADLSQVHSGKGAAEYADPVEFYRRTFMTEGLQTLLRNAMLRLGGVGGDPVVELQTNFGGGKTHSMLALYHITSDVDLGALPGFEPILAEAKAAGVDTGVVPHRAVLVGTALSPGQVDRKDDGTEIHTLWGQLAWQLGRRKGYALIADSDKAGLNPGSDLLVRLFEEYSPALILIDEWLVYVRQLYEQSGMPAGSFDANLSFAQSLTEAVRRSPQTLLVASLPASDIEKGGEGGRQALERLQNIFGRMQTAWRPATTEEGFEIVRRRLFEPIAAQADFTSRDAVIRAFTEMYRKDPAQFPRKTRESDYRKRMEAAYPIHPELFDQLYGAWSTLDKFQRTRGVLRLMASVIHTLWQRNDAGLLIMPASVPLDAGLVTGELMNYLDLPWKPIIEHDVDGEHALPIQIDKANTNYGRVSATRRVARSVFLGSAPTYNTANRGIEDRDIILASAQPGESAPVFGDALRALSDRATHLYVDHGKYWFSTQPSVNRTAQERADQYRVDAVYQEVAERIKQQKNRGDFLRVHPCPLASSDVRDEREIGLVVLDPEHRHTGKLRDSPAMQQAAAILNQRGESPRLYRNSLVFAAADATKWVDLEAAVRQCLAWKSIVQEANELNLDAFQRSQAETKLKQSEEAVKSRLTETYTWVLAPRQEKTGRLVEWDEAKTQGDGTIAERVSNRLRNDGTLYTVWAGTMLRKTMDDVPLWRGDHVAVKELADYFAQYLYLPKLKSSDVLCEAIANGLGNLLWSTETFALADYFDPEKQRYAGLIYGQHRTPTLDQFVVKPDVALRQIEAERAPDVEIDRQPGGGTGTGVARTGDGETGGGPQPPLPPPPPPERKTRRYYGSVTIDPMKLSTESGKIVQEVLQHLVTLPGAKVTVSMQIEARVEDGIPEGVRRAVAENSSTLKFDGYDFEES